MDPILLESFTNHWLKYQRVNSNSPPPKSSWRSYPNQKVALARDSAESYMTRTSHMGLETQTSWMIRLALLKNKGEEEGFKIWKKMHCWRFERCHPDPSPAAPSLQPLPLPLLFQLSSFFFLFLFYKQRREGWVTLVTRPTKRRKKMLRGNSSKTSTRTRDWTSWVQWLSFHTLLPTQIAMSDKISTILRDI